VRGKDGPIGNAPQHQVGRADGGTDRTEVKELRQWHRPAELPAHRRLDPGPEGAAGKDAAGRVDAGEDLPFGHDERRIGWAPSDVSASPVLSER
jgi:hypothetical protein